MWLRLLQDRSKGKGKGKGKGKKQMPRVVFTKTVCLRDLTSADVPGSMRGDCAPTVYPKARAASVRMAHLAKYELQSPGAGIDSSCQVSCGMARTDILNAPGTPGRPPQWQVPPAECQQVWRYLCL